MAFDTFGYNGAVQLTEALVGKLFAAQAYDANLVGRPGQIPNADFIPLPPIDLGLGNSIDLYLLSGKPTVALLTHDGSNEVFIDVPFISVGVFSHQNEMVQRSTIDEALGISLDNIFVQKTPTDIKVDFSKVTAANVTITLIGVTPGATGVGAKTDTFGPLTDAALDSKLTGLGVPLKAADLRQKIATAVTGGSLGGTIHLALGAGGTNSSLGAFDLALFDGQALGRGNGGADLLLFNVDGTGRGNPAGAVDTIPISSRAPQFGFDIAVRGDLVVDGINAAFDAGQYFVQNHATSNAPADPFGFMVVPGVSKMVFSLPMAGAVVTIDPPSGGKVQITISPGGLSPNARAHLDVLGTTTSSSFTAESNGSATFSVAAVAGDRLALTVDAASAAGDQNLVLWRPVLTLEDGYVAVKVHLYYYVDNWFDIEGDARIHVSLVPDPNTSFAAKAQIIYTDVDLPWWFWGLEFMVPFVVGPAIGTVVQALAPGIAEQLGSAIVKDKGQSIVDKFAGQLAFPAPGGMATFLEKIDVTPRGIVLSGYGDAGVLLGYGRSEAWTNGGALELETATPNPIYMRFNWTLTSSGMQLTCPVRIAAPATQGAPGFWVSTYDDLPDESMFTRDPITLAIGQPSWIWVELPTGHAKVLLDWRTLGLALQASYVAYQARAVRGVTIVDQLQATVVGGFQSVTLEETLYRYEGAISLATVKFFLSGDTVATQDEHWFWDGAEIPPEGISQPGLTVTLDSAHHQLLVSSDSSGLQNPDPGIHWVWFRGVDVFGTDSGLVKKLIIMPSKTLRPRPIAVIPQGRINPLGPDDFRNPLIAIIEDRMGPLAQTSEGQALATTLARATTQGSTVLDAAGASLILQLIGVGGDFQRFG